jgi:hypothetical protein
VATSRIVTDLHFTNAGDRIELTVDEGVVSRDAIYGAACAFTDRCYVRLAPAGPSPDPTAVTIVLRAKAGRPFDGAALGTELKEELLEQALRQRMVEDGEEFTTSLLGSAFGASASLGDVDAVHAQETFDDPLGIALSWEEKYAKTSAEGGSGEGQARPPEGEKGT